MKKKKAVPVIVAVACSILFFGSVVKAENPAPPANQLMGLPDSIFNNLVEAECRACHDYFATSNVDRHHLLYGDTLKQGECSVNGDACLSDTDCDEGICSSPPLETCIFDTDCDDFGLGETCGEVCLGETVAPNLDANQDGVNDTRYGCLNCHNRTNIGGVITFLVERDCLECHIQIPGEASVHHLTDVAQGRNSPKGDPAIGDCTTCHGTLVDDIGDGHIIPIYSPSLVTPSPSGGTGDPENIRGNGAGACDYCHDWGDDTGSGVEVFTNEDTHHNTGVFQSETGVVNGVVCTWCHNVALPDEYAIRVCERCHGYESLHNIQTDSAGNYPCACTPGEELPGYGHVGADDPGGDSDCWGCHGFSFSSSFAPGMGPITPFINSADPVVMTAGANTPVTLTGSSFTNTVGTYVWKSTVVLTAENGFTIPLTPSTIDGCSLTVTIPGTTPAGNYELRAVKNTTQSNPVVVSIKPAVVITNVTCFKCLGTMVITGSGFSDYSEGTDEDINVTEDGRMLNVISWSPTQIQASGARCSGAVTVNALFGSATWQQ